MRPYIPPLIGNLLHDLLQYFQYLQYLQYLHYLQSIIPTNQPSHNYHIRHSHSCIGKSGIDHIFTDKGTRSIFNPCDVDKHTILPPPTLRSLPRIQGYSYLVCPKSSPTHSSLHSSTIIVNLHRPFPPPQITNMRRHHQLIV